MTFSAARSERDPHTVDVRITHGPVTVEVSEHPGHLRSFWGQLGRLLDQVEQPDDPAPSDDDPARTGLDLPGDAEQRF